MRLELKNIGEINLDFDPRQIGEGLRAVQETLSPQRPFADPPVRSIRSIEPMPMVEAVVTPVLPSPPPAPLPPPAESRIVAAPPAPPRGGGAIARDRPSFPVTLPPPPASFQATQAQERQVSLLPPPPASFRAAIEEEEAAERKEVWSAIAKHGIIDAVLIVGLVGSAYLLWQRLHPPAAPIVIPSQPAVSATPSPSRATPIPTSTPSTSTSVPVPALPIPTGRQ